MKTIIVIIFLLFTLTQLSACGNRQDQTDAGNELTIATFRENRFLEFAARKFEEINEGVSITINTYGDETEFDTARYSQIINTALMGGGGEDIIDVSVLDWVTLADSNRLLDLKNKIYFSPETHYQSILDAYLYNGGRFAVPLSFNFTAFRLDEPYTHIEIPNPLTLTALMSLAAEEPDVPLFISATGLCAVSLTHMMFEMNFSDYIDVRNKEANVDNEKFMSLLKNVSSIENLRVREPGEMGIVWEILIYNPVMSVNGIEDYSGLFLLTNDDGESLFSPVGFLPSLNKNSPNQELALDFMRFLVSEEIQSSPELMFNPVNRNASAEMAVLVLGQVRAGGYAAEGFDLERNIAIFNELVESLRVVRHSDVFISNFVRAELTRYFDGEVGLEQAAKNLQARLNTYLNE